jgi:PTH1 family peptidyl-tRNA hydrolase
LRSIHSHLGSPDYVRVRLGVGHPGDKEKVHGHVLSDFSSEDRKWLEPELDALAKALPALLAGRDSDFMSQVTMAVQQATGTGRKPKAKPDDKTSPEPAQPGETPADPPAAQQTSIGAALNRAMSKIRGS